MDSRKQRDLVLLTIGATVLSLLIAALNAFRLPFLNPSTAGEILAFSTVTVVAFLLFLVSLVLLVRNTLRIYGEGSSRVLGARLRTRMVWGAVLISLLPITAMFAFSYQLMNRAVERWFSQPAAALRSESVSVAQDLSLYVTANARAEASSIANGLSNGATAKGGGKLFLADLQSHEATLQGGFVVLYQDGVPSARFRTPVADDATIVLEPAQTSSSTVMADADVRGPAPAQRGALRTILWQAAQSGESEVLSINGTDYLVGSAWHNPRSLVVVALPLPAGLNRSMQRLRHDGDQYWILFRQRKQIRLTYMLLMLMISTLALFCASWLALHLSRQVTRPVEALAEAMTALSQGDYDRRVDAATTAELGELVTVFNTMAGELQNSRRLVEHSTRQVVDANAALDWRRRELETMLQTIPNGVVMLDLEHRVRLANRAFSEMLDPGGQRSFVGETLEDILPSENLGQVDRLLQRSHRMSSASAEMEMPSPAGTLNVAITAALLEPGGPERSSIGYVLVIENATELLRAQKQSAWKEVARRVAHEIKNPLTPISLSAEQIRRHIGRIADLLAANSLESSSVGTIHRSSEVISGSVESMRSLVDQFSTLAEFPNARPRPADLNTVVENTLAMFAGRLHGIAVTSDLGPALPLVLADPEAMKRALSNLIDNAAEAMSHSLLREIRISTGSSGNADNMVELTVADTGPGVTDEMRERLFLPYFSTKQRGSGLGLTIVSKIVADHQGTIRVEKNQPSGARFVIELPTASHAQDAAAPQPDRARLAPAAEPAVTAETHA